MIASISQWAFPASVAIKTRLEQAKAAGFDAMELALGETAACEGELTLSSTKRDAVALRKLADALELEISSFACGLHWKYPLTDNQASVRKRGRMVLEKACQVAEWLGVDAILVVPGVVTDTVSYDVAYSRAQEALGALAPAAEEHGVCIGVENVWNKFLLSPLEFARFLDEIGHPNVRAFFDVGNVLIYGYPEQWITILGKRIARVHVKDFKRSVHTINGFVDLLEGDVNWPAVMTAFRAIGYDGSFAAELGPYTHVPDMVLRSTALALRAIFAL